IGRDAEIQRILEKLQRGHCSLVGPSGSGKSLLLRVVQQRAAAPGWGAPGETLALNCGLCANLPQLQQEVAQRLGVEAKKLSAQLRRQPPRLLLLDDLGGMDRGETGYKMRRWLRGLADDAGTRLLLVSHQRLDLIFAADDPARGSLLAALDTRPVELGPLAPAACLALIEARLAGGDPRAGGWAIAAFADLAALSLQPRELLHRCAERADALLSASR
ncbi:MAG TPA: AAA family ATPase, partial [Herpetosiphonaceae bacterium]